MNCFTDFVLNVVVTFIHNYFGEIQTIGTNILT